MQSSARSFPKKRPKRLELINHSNSAPLRVLCVLCVKFTARGDARPTQVKSLAIQRAMEQGFFTFAVI